jgi:uncharacterized membrane protein YeaQ/YmgE (transglycosylase-associated protein family)
VIGAIILGIVAGFLARALLPGKQDLGFLATILLGILGALVGFFFFTELLGIGDTEIFDLGGLIGAVIGSMVLLFIYDRYIASRSKPAAASRRQVEGGESRPQRERRPDRERRDPSDRGSRRDRDTRD